MTQDAKSLTFTVLAKARIIQDYEAAFQTATGLSLTLIPAGTLKKRVSLGRHENPFCALMAGSAGGCEACSVVQAQAQRRLGRKLVPVELRCFAGLTDVAVPVVVGGQHVATLLGGQVFLQKRGRRGFASLAQRLIEWGLQTDLHLVNEAYFHTKVVSKEQFRAAVRLLTIFAEHLAAHANRLILARHADEPLSVTRAKEFVRSRSTESLTMRDAAHHVHLSAVYFCKMFKKATGMTFTEYVARVRVEKTKSLLLNPQLRIGEAAYASGFQSIPHFNRVFKKFEGVSPTEFRARGSRDPRAKIRKEKANRRQAGTAPPE